MSHFTGSTLNITGKYERFSANSFPVHVFVSC
jgi:hypothetical protein